MKIVSWNMQNKRKSWRFLLDHHRDYDFAFVQEACTPPPYVPKDAPDWDIPYEVWEQKPKKYRQEIVRISNRWSFERLSREQISDATPDGRRIAIPRFRAAGIARRDGERPICLVCVVSGEPATVRLPATVRTIRAVLHERGFDEDTSMIVAGDLTNDIHRTSTPFAELEQMGLIRIGPEGVNFYSILHKEGPPEARLLLNHAFVTEDLIERTRATALNHPREWGPSDHCRVSIEVGFTGSYSHWTCQACDARIGDLVELFRAENPDLDERLHRARMIVEHQASHARQPSRQSGSKNDYSGWICDNCGKTMIEIREEFAQRWKIGPEYPNWRIVGGHKAHHTHQTKR